MLLIPDARHILQHKSTRLHAADVVHHSLWRNHVGRISPAQRPPYLGRSRLSKDLCAKKQKVTQTRLKTATCSGSLLYGWHGNPAVYKSHFSQRFPRAYPRLLGPFLWERMNSIPSCFAATTSVPMPLQSLPSMIGHLRWQCDSTFSTRGGNSQCQGVRNFPALGLSGPKEPEGPFEKA